MFSAASQHVLARIASTPARREPFLHLVVDEVFPPAFYAEMQRNLPSDEDFIRLVDTGRVGKNYSPHRFCLMPADRRGSDVSPRNAFWEDLFAEFKEPDFLKAWVQLFGAAIRERVATDFAESQARESVYLRPEVFLMRDREGYQLGPHRDTRTKAMTALFYLPPNDEMAAVGTSFYRLRPGAPVTQQQMGQHYLHEFFDLIETVGFLPNRMLAFPNLPNAVHGVEPIASPRGGRDVLIFDVKFST